MLSTAKSESVARSLKEALEKRGFAVVESTIAKGRKLSIDSDKMTLSIEAQDAVSKDVFGNDLDAFTPHKVKFAIDSTAGATHSEVAKAMIEIAKIGFAIKIGEGADIAAAEVAAEAADEQPYNVQWPTRGA